MMYWGNHMSTGSWIFSIFGTLIILALIVAAIVWIVSETGNRGSGRDASAASPGEILDRRLASGEITVDQYDQLREKLAITSASSDPRPTSPAGAGAPG
jgi:putative membrane protein